MIRHVCTCVSFRRERFMTASRIRIKMGQIEVECEGSEQFLKKELPDLLESVTRLYEQSGPVRDETDCEKREGAQVPPTGIVIGTTATLAGQLNVKSGNDLVIAAAAQLTLVGGKAEFSRQELLASVKSASGYFKDSYGKNFSNYLNGRVKAGQLVEPRSGHYALGAEKRKELEATLAN